MQLKLPDPSRVIQEEYEALEKRDHKDKEVCRATMIAGMFIADAIREAGQRIAEAIENHS